MDQDVVPCNYNKVVFLWILITLEWLKFIEKLFIMIEYLGWMDSEIEIRKISISNDNEPKMVIIGDDLLGNYVVEIVLFLKEYGNVFL